MKRLAILSITAIFATSSIAAAPVSFAQEIKTPSGASAPYGDQYTEEGTAGYTEEVSELPVSSAVKDTSWFDYTSPKKTYRISTESELIGLSSLVNENQVDKWKPARIENFEDVTFVLQNDIELTAPWIPIGSGSASYFAGVFDGNGHTISGLQIDSNVGSAGLFGYLVGSVRDLTVKGTIHSGDKNCGGIAGVLDSRGSITGCTSYVDITAKDKSGGIAGYSSGGKIEKCSNLGNISGSCKTGGITGENWGGKITECSNFGTVTSSKRGVGTFGTGGIAGRSVSADAEITLSYNKGKIRSNTEGTGGITGYMNSAGSSVKNCYNTGEITVKQNKSTADMTDSYAGGIAGIVGTADAVVKNCYSTAAVFNADYSGGIAGYYINNRKLEKNSRYIHNNYFPSSQFKEGIGLLYDTTEKHLTHAANSVSSRSFSHLASTLNGSEYKNDTGIYGNNGYPVLKWQKPVNEEEKVYIDCIPEDVQKEFDRYLSSNQESSKNIHHIISFFAPSAYMNDMAVTYNDNDDDK